METLPKDIITRILILSSNWNEDKKRPNIFLVCREWNTIGKTKRFLFTIDNLGKKILVETLSRRGTSELKLKHYEASISYYDEVLHIDPRNTRALNNKAVALKNLGQYIQAIRCLDRLLKFKPNYVKALNNKGEQKKLF